jgi:hypothetical protein
VAIGEQNTTHPVIVIVFQRIVHAIVDFGHINCRFVPGKVAGYHMGSTVVGATVKPPQGSCARDGEGVSLSAGW